MLLGVSPSQSAGEAGSALSSRTTQRLSSSSMSTTQEDRYNKVIIKLQYSTVEDRYNTDNTVIIQL